MCPCTLVAESCLCVLGTRKLEGLAFFKASILAQSGKIRHKPNETPLFTGGFPFTLEACSVQMNCAWWHLAWSTPSAHMKSRDKTCASNSPETKAQVCVLPAETSSKIRIEAMARRSNVLCIMTRLHDQPQWPSWPH